MVPTPAPDRAPSLVVKSGFALFLLAYFFYFNADSLRVGFAPDDMMNIFQYWRPGALRLVYSQFFLWHDFYRPMGGVFYLPLFSRFEFNPAPFHAVQLGLLLVNTFLLYWLARLLGAARLSAWFAAVVVAHHAGLGNLYFDTAFIYDVLCSVFFLGAMVCYIRPRGEGRRLRSLDAAAFFACYLCALNSKEMAVTLPLAVLAYEWCYHRRAMRLRVALIAGVVALPYVYGRVLGLGGIIHHSGYALNLSLDRVLTFQEDAIRDLFLLPQDVGWKTVVSLWAGLTYFAWRRDRPILRWCWFVMAVTPIPVEFLEGRRAAVLAIPMAGWALFAAILVFDLAGVLSKQMEFEPGFRRLAPPTRVALVLGFLLFLWSAQNQWTKQVAGIRSMAETGELTAHVIDQFRQLDPHVRPRTAITFLHDPFEGWDMYFIAQLWFRDRTIDVKLQSKTPQPLDGFASVFDYRDGKLIQVR